MEIGERIRQRRKELNMTQEDLAQKLGYKHKASINMLESGKRNITPEKIKAIADALDTTPDWIMGWDKCYDPATGMINISMEIDLMDNLREALDKTCDPHICKDFYFSDDDLFQIIDYAEYIAVKGKKNEEV